MKNRFILAFICVLLFLSLCTFAQDTLKAMPLFTFDGQSLSDFAGMQSKPDIQAKSGYAINLNSGIVVYDKCASDIVYPASTVKLMTAIVAYENIPDLDTEITASEQAVRKASGSNVAIKAGNVYTARELLNALLIVGANDAALVLADYVSGSEAQFCLLMNEKAKQLGAENTTYANVTGFHSEGSVTTARDTALIAQYFYYIPELFDMSNAAHNGDSDKFRILVNRNLLISRASVDDYYYSSAGGMSAGSTEEGGHCVVSTVQAQDNQLYLCVVMGSAEINDVNYAYKDIISLFDFCKSEFSYQPVLSTKNVVCEIPVNNAVDVDHVALFPKNEIKMLLPNELDVTKDITLEKRVEKENTDAPVNRGDSFGEVVVKYKGYPIGKSDIVSDVSVDKSNVLYFLSRTKTILLDSWFSKFLIVAAVLFAIYFGVSIYYKYFKKNKYTGNRPRSK